jgi:hypothetical protein
MIRRNSHFNSRERPSRVRVSNVMKTLGKKHKRDGSLLSPEMAAAAKTKFRLRQANRL